MSMRRAVWCSVIFAVLSACSASHVDSSTARATLLRRDAEWADAAKSGKDVDRIVSYWTDDALIIFPGQPTFEGKKALRAGKPLTLHLRGITVWRLEPDGQWRCVADVSNEAPSAPVPPST